MDIKQMTTSVESVNDRPQRKMVRIWCDGCYDLVHFGHANQLRQAKEMGDYLVIGVHTDEDITMHKGAPVFNESERYRLIHAIKWVDEVVEAAPFHYTSVELLDKYNCDFCVHGDDLILTEDGKDTYYLVKAAGRYKECHRTEGISTTGLVGRMLRLTEDNHNKSNQLNHESMKFGTASSWTAASHVLPTSRTIQQFSTGRKPKPTDRIVYVCGAFDLFHIGHLSFLEEAAKLGDYLIVGIYSDQLVNQYKGHHQPIMTLMERVLTVFAYRPVSEVVISAPFSVTAELMDHFKVDFVCQGSRVFNEIPDPMDGKDPYRVPKERGKFVTIDSNSDITTMKIVERIVAQRIEFEARNRGKVAKELAENPKEGRTQRAK